MMTWSNGNIFRVTGTLCGEFIVSPVNSPHKGQWRGALIFSSNCAWINGWVNNREAGNLRRHCAHYDGIVMYKFSHTSQLNQLLHTSYFTWPDEIHQYIIAIHCIYLSTASTALVRAQCTICTITHIIHSEENSQCHIDGSRTPDYVDSIVIIMSNVLYSATYIPR